MDPQTAANQKAVDVARSMLNELETDINVRNSYINKRYSMVYEDAIMAGLSIKAGHDVTKYNYLPRVVDIHAAQLFGRMPQVITSYDKEDLSIFDIGVTDPEAAKAEKEKARLRNARKFTDAEVRNLAIRNIMLDNDFESMIARGATIGAVGGITVIKGWLDKKAETYKFSLLETPQNFARYWSNSNFRENDADFYMYQISVDKANRQYASKLKPGEKFATSQVGAAWWRAGDAMDLQKKTIPKVWVIDATGYFRGLTSSNGVISDSDGTDQKPFNIIIVGDKVVEVNDSNLPIYTVVNHEDQPGKPWGRSAISEELISVSQTMIETMSDWRTASWKLSFPKFKGIGMDSLNAPSMEERQSAIIPLGEGQDLLPLMYDNTLQEFPRLMQELWNSFTKLAKVSRVMLDDPTINPSSNQGMMTSMKPLIDATEDRQKRWNCAIVKMFTTALDEVATLGGDGGDALKEAISQQDWKVQIKWPSIFRRDDPSYQQMLNNQWNAGILSHETYLEALGYDASEEVDRLRDAMEDPLRASILGRIISQMATYSLHKSLGIPPQGYLNTKVQLRGELAPSEVGNLGATYGLNQGPYGDEVGPQGFEGAMMNADTINSGMYNGEPRNGGTANYKTAAQMNPQAANPTLTPDQNTTGQPVSQPGSGAPAVTAQGAINQVNQHAGK